MGTAPTDKEAVPVKWGLIATFILGAVLLIAAIWSLSRALSNSSPHGPVALASEAAATNAAMVQAELERQHDLVEQLAAPVIQSPAVTQPVVVPTKPREDEARLQKAKSKVNQRIIERMKQYVKDNPTLDNRDIEEQIKKRENQGAQIQ